MEWSRIFGSRTPQMQILDQHTNAFDTPLPALGDRSMREFQHQTTREERNRVAMMLPWHLVEAYSVPLMALAGPEDIAADIFLLQAAKIKGRGFLGRAFAGIGRAFAGVGGFVTKNWKGVKNIWKGGKKSSRVATDDGLGSLISKSVSGNEIHYSITGVEKTQVAKLDSKGLLSLDLNTEGVKGAGQYILDDALGHFGDDVQGIVADWTMRSDYPGNMSLGLKQFWQNYDLMEGNMFGDELLEYSARNTRLGQILDKKGFSKIDVGTAEADVVEVEFRR